MLVQEDISTVHRLEVLAEIPDAMVVAHSRLYPTLNFSALSRILPGISFSIRHVMVIGRSPRDETYLTGPRQ